MALVYSHLLVVAVIHLRIGECLAGVDHGAPKVGIAGVTLGSEHAQATLVSLEVEDLVARHLGVVAGAIEVHVVRRGTDAAQATGKPFVPGK